MWRHAETGAVVDLASFWVAGQPNGVRVQNCAGIWELVSSAASQGRSSSYTACCGQDGAGSKMTCQFRTVIRAPSGSQLLKRVPVAVSSA